MGVYVYADESGHSGRNIFDTNSPTYYQGSIISLGDVDPIIGKVIQHHCQELKVPRIHSNEHQELKSRIFLRQNLSIYFLTVLIILESLHSGIRPSCSGTPYAWR